MSSHIDFSGMAMGCRHVQATDVLTSGPRGLQILQRRIRQESGLVKNDMVKPGGKTRWKPGEKHGLKV